MTISEEYAKRVKTPKIEATIYTYPTGEKPSSDPPFYGNEYQYTLEAISCSLSFGYDQQSASCVLEIETPFVGIIPKIFSPMDKVVVKQGWNSVDTLTSTFFGFIDTVNLEDFPRVQRLECKDILKLAQNNYYVNANKKCYCFEVQEEDGLGGQSEADRYAEKIIQDLLVESGIPISRQDLEPCQFQLPDTTWVRVVIGNHYAYYIQYKTAMDAINEICDLIGYKIWASSDGMVKLRFLRPFASADYAYSYSTLTGGHIFKISTKQDDISLRNWIDVVGYRYDGAEVTIPLQTGWNSFKYEGVDDTASNLFDGAVANFIRAWVFRDPTWYWYDPTDPGGSTLSTISSGELVWINVSASSSFTYYSSSGFTPTESSACDDSNYVTDPPKYRRAEVNSDLVDTQSVAKYIADYVLSDLNRLAYSANADIEGDPRLQIGQTVRLIDPSTTGSGVNYFLYDYSSNHTVDSYTMSLTCVGGTGIGSESSATGYQSQPNTGTIPVAAFTNYITQSGSNTYINVTSTSYDPDGPTENLSYLWISTGYPNANGITNSYIYAGLVGYINVQLNVTDLDANSCGCVQQIVFSGVI